MPMKSKDPIIDQKAVGSFIREKRLEHDLTQAHLAEFCTVSVETIKKWEQGSRLPTITDIVKLSRLFHVKIETFLQLDSDESSDCSVITAAEAPDYNDLPDNTSFTIEENCESNHKFRPGLILLIAGLSTLVLMLFLFIAGLIRLQNMAMDDYQNTTMTRSIEQFDISTEADSNKTDEEISQ